MHSASDHIIRLLPQVNEGRSPSYYAALHSELRVTRHDSWQMDLQHESSRGEVQSWFDRTVEVGEDIKVTRDTFHQGSDLALRGWSWNH